MIRRVLAKPVVRVVIALLGVLGAAALYWFQPWRAVTNTTVTEQLSAGAVVAQGSFVTHEHDTSGTARLIRNADGSHQLELAGLDTSDGPDLRVWLSDQPVRAGEDGWHVFDDGKHVELGRLKGNRGDQVYRIDAGVDLDALRSVSIWCKRFSVSFGAAALQS